MGKEQQRELPRATVDGRKVYWVEGVAYVDHDGRMAVLPNGNTVGVVQLSNEKEGVPRKRYADLVVETEVVRARGRLLAGIAIGVVIGGMGVGVLNRASAETNPAAAVISEPDASSKQTPESSTTDSSTKPKTPATVVVTANPTAEPLPTDPQQCLKELPLDVKVGQMTVLGVPGGADFDKLAIDFNNHYIGGAIIMKEPANAKASMAGFAAKQQIPISFSVDQEGGNVQRFTSIGKLPSQQEMASKPLDEVQKLMGQHYAKLKETGINVVLGPVADVDGGATNNPIGPGRMYGKDAEKVAQLTNINLKAAQANNLTGTLKHFPGLGKADGNPDFKVGVATPPYEIIKKDFAPYAKAENKDKVSVMLSSAITPGLTDDAKEKMAMFSKKTVNVLRNELGYKNSVLYTDALNSEQIMATDMGISDAFVEATIAGVDAKIIVETVGTNVEGKPVTFSEQATTNSRKIEAALKENRLTESHIDAQVARIFGQKGLNACTVLANVR